jgi:hypothetical protein
MKREISTQQFDQWVAILAPEKWAQGQLEKCRAAYADGDKRSLALAIQLCGEFKWPLPDWAVEAFNAGLKAIVEFEISSWDEILGGNVRTPGRMRIAKEARRIQLAIAKALPTHANEEIDADFFERLSREVGATARQARDLYYKLPAEVKLPATRRRPPPPRRKK